MMDPEEISRKASREKQKERKKSRRRKCKWPKKRGQKLPLDPFGWKIYSRIYPWGYNALFWVFFVATVGGAGLIVYYIESSHVYVLYGSLILIGAFLLRLMVHFAVKIFRYNTYKNWPKRLGFEVTGWSRMNGEGKFPEYQKWMENVMVNIVLIYEDAKGRELVRDSLYILKTEANKCFYEKNFTQAGYAGEIRKKWSATEDGLSAFGSANSLVMGEIYRTISQYLYAIHKKYNIIRTVSIHYEGRVYDVEPERIYTD